MPAKPGRQPARRSLGGERASVKRLAALDAAALKQPTKGVPAVVRNKSVVSVKKKTLPKLFVLDTNIPMHDPISLFSFEENDITLPFIVLEELDRNKKGYEDPNRNARETSRMLDGIFSTCHASEISTGVSLVVASKGDATGSVFVCKSKNDKNMTADNIIIETVQGLVDKNIEEKKYSSVVLVSNDINMRLKARSFGIEAQDYKTDKTLEDSDVLPSGIVEISPNFISTIENLDSWRKGEHVYYKAPPRFKLSKVEVQENEFLTDGKVHYQVISKDSDGIILRVPTDYTVQKNNVFGAIARNTEQSFALNLLMNPSIDFVTITGQAGCGKTYLTLAAALQQTIEKDTERFSEIIYTRITIPVGEDIGFLPGTEEEKMTPWAGALQDNIDALIPHKPGIGKKSDSSHRPSEEWERSATMELIRTRVKVKSLSFMRGRTFFNKFLIIDEAQNLTPKQMKTLITRAGPGTKIVCLGNLGQIDSPYLSMGSSGLTYTIERFGGWKHGGHVTLLAGERSRLANHANKVL